MSSTAEMPNETHDWEKALTNLREQADRDFPSAWIPDEPGAELYGVLRSIKPAVRTTYGPVPVLELEDPRTHTSFSLWLLHTVLRRSVWRLKPVVGELMYVRYDGRVKPEGGGTAYEGYTVLVDRPDQGDEVDWEAIAKRYDPDVFEEREPEITRGPDEDLPGAPGPDDDDIPF
jgi:hypothetical protein